MAFPLRYLIAAAAGLGGLLPLAPRAGAQPAPEPPVEFRVVSMADVTTVFYDVDAKKEIVNAGVGSFSRPYPAPKNREIVLYTEIAGADATRPPVKLTLAKAVLPEKKPGPFLILLSKNTTGSEPAFGSLVIDHSLEAHPPKGYRVFNFSKRRLAVGVADANLVLAPGQSAAASYPDTRKAWLKVAAEDPREGWLLVSSSPHVVGGADSRTTVFLVDIPPSERDPDPKGVVVRRIRENITTEPAGVRRIR